MLFHALSFLLTFALSWFLFSGWILPAVAVGIALIIIHVLAYRESKAPIERVPEPQSQTESSSGAEVTASNRTDGRKIAHDLRSPMTVFTVLSRKMNFASPSDKQLFEDAMVRLTEIANDLMKRG